MGWSICACLVDATQERGQVQVSSFRLSFVLLTSMISLLKLMSFQLKMQLLYPRIVPIYARVMNCCDRKIRSMLVRKLDDIMSVLVKIIIIIITIFFYLEVLAALT